MNQILFCDWLPERASWSYLARSGLPAVSRKKNFPESHIINPLLTKLVTHGTAIQKIVKLFIRYVLATFTVFSTFKQSFCHINTTKLYQEMLNNFITLRSNHTELMVIFITVMNSSNFVALSMNMNTDSPRDLRRMRDFEQCVIIEICVIISLCFSVVLITEFSDCSFPVYGSS